MQTGFPPRPKLDLLLLHLQLPDPISLIGNAPTTVSIYALGEIGCGNGRANFTHAIRANHKIHVRPRTLLLV